VSHLTVLPVAIPLLAAAILMGAQPLLRRRWLDAAGIATAATVMVLCALLTRSASAGTLIDWAGAWRPRQGVALGVAFVVDPFGAGLACLAASLATASLVFSWRYFEAVGTLYHALMLVFLGGMTGFCLTGDLFDLFVFFELMSVAAYGLTGYKIEEEKSLEGALNFAVVNSVGAFLILIGIGLLYGRTGALNLAQIGRELSLRPADGLVVASFVLIVSGLAVKGALVPFHFWLADAHAVAPSPVCVLFSGVMVELGIYGIARVYWTAYAIALEPHRDAVGGIFLTAGAVSAVLGGMMCLAQRHIKRLLAFSTISHMGMLLMAGGLLSPRALAGAAVYTVAHGLVKFALFLLAGILLHSRQSVDELELRGRGRRMPLTGAAFLVAVMGMAGVPPFGTGPGKTLIEEAGRHAGRGWVTVPLVLAACLTAGAVLRVAGRVFLGWGPREEPGDEGARGDEARETKTGDGHAPAIMLAPVIVLLAAAGATGLLARSPSILAAAERFTDSRSYQAIVLDGTSESPRSAESMQVPPGSGWIATLVTASSTVAIALLALFGHRLPISWRHAAARLRRMIVDPIRSIHSGKVGDYVTWLTLGVAAFGATLALSAGLLNYCGQRWHEDRRPEPAASASVSVFGQRGVSPLQACLLRPVTERNCVAARRGGEQREVNESPVG
jgi:multicomponent Na+:H+ antiporter subunit D